MTQSGENEREDKKSPKRVELDNEMMAKKSLSNVKKGNAKTGWGGVILVPDS